MYGFIRDEIQPEDYVLGGGHIPQKETLVEDGDWTRYLPLFERQAKNFETAGCTVFGTLNALEMLFHRLTGKESNFSDRFLYILAGIRPPGGSAHKVAEVIRDNGLILEEKLPMTKTFEEYITPDPIPVDLLIEGQHFLNSWDMKHEFLWRDMQDSNKKEKIKEALKYSPVGVSVHAWKKQGKIYTKSTFDDDNHWCVCFKVDDEGYYHIFDTYDNDIKILSPDYDFEIAKVYFLFARTEPRKPTQGIIKGILKTLISLYKHLYEVVKAEEEKEAVEKPPVKVEEKPVIINSMDKLETFCKAIQEFEGFYKGSRSYRNNNPGNIKFAFQANTTGKDDKGFAIFKTYEDGFSALKNMVKRACEGQSKIYKPDMTILQYFEKYAPSNDGNHPKTYATHVCKKLNMPLTTKIKELLT